MGIDGGADIDALTFDMSAAGAATFNSSVKAGAGLRISTDGSNNGVIQTLGQDKDMFFSGDDGGAGINALVLDMSAAGAATFNAGIVLGDSLAGNGAPFTISNTSNGNNIDIKTTSSGSLVHAVKIHSHGLFESKQGIQATFANINGQLNVTGTTNGNTISMSQLSTQFDTSSFLRLHPASTTNSGGFTNIFFGTSTSNNYGVAIGGKRAGTNDEPTFAVRMLNDSVTGTEVLSITNAGDVRVAANATGAALIKGVSGNQADRNNSGYPQYTFVGNEGTGMRRVSSNILALDTSGAERMRLASNGRASIGTTTGNAGLTVSPDIRAMGPSFANDGNSITMSQESSGGFITARGPSTSERGTIGLSVNMENGGSGRVGLKIENDASVTMAYMPSGSASSDVHINLSTNKLFYVSSSQRYKTNITDLSTSTADILSLRPVNYDRVSKELTGEVGLIAEEVYKTIPHLVNLADVEGFDTPQPESVKYSQLSVYLLKAIQELSTTVDELKAEIEELKG